MVWNRTHFEVLDPETLPWQALRLAGAPTGAVVRVLSADAEDGAVTALVRIPPGWMLDGPWALGTAFDAFVLEGSLRLGGQQFERYAYTYRPAGFANAALRSEAGALVLVMTYGAAALVTPDAQEHSTKAIEHVRLEDVPARQPLTDKVNMGYFSRTLRLDPDTGERIFVTGNERAGVGDPRIEWHPVVEEIYKLGPRGSMDYPYNQIMLEPGSYCYRPPGIPHGGFETWEPSQFSSFIRVNATLVNNYVDEVSARAMLREYGRERLDPIVAARIDRAD
ncbi:MAG TPA: hypothetical protein VGL99_28065 [Chloroflexota bacterium]|jgi:hypothetical protein